MHVNELRKKLESLGPWQQKIKIADGVFTTGHWEPDAQVEAFCVALGVSDFTGMTIVDTGANACGQSVAFARMGARVIALEPHLKYLAQARFVIDALELNDQIELRQGGVPELTALPPADVVCFLGLLYHFRDPMFILEFLTNVKAEHLVISNQTIPGERWDMRNRRDHDSYRKGAPWVLGWEPTEILFLKMLESVGFEEIRRIPTPPNATNRSYFVMKQAKKPRDFLANAFAYW